MTNAQMAIALINQIIAMQSPDDQRAVVADVIARYDHTPAVELLQDHDVAERYGVHIVRVREWLSRGELKGFKEARRWYTRSDWVKEFEERKAGQSS